MKYKNLNTKLEIIYGPIDFNIESHTMYRAVEK